MKILYLSHVDWQWIRQRPQLLCEALAREVSEVDARYLPAWRRGVRTKQPSSIRARRLPHIPPIRPWIRWLVNPLLRRAWLTLSADEPTYVWLTHPSLLTSVPRRWRDRLIYDAMDLNTQFPGADQKRVSEHESALVRSARVVFASSERIRSHIMSLDANANVVLARNALDSTLKWPIFEEESHDRAVARAPEAKGIAMYVGTIASWIDVEALALLKASNSTLRVILVGPVERELAQRLQSCGIELTGAKPHSSLIDVMRSADVLIMPFALSELVEAVDPVKLYEYIAMLKPIVTIWYEELRHFTDLVQFYSKPSEFADRVNASIGGYISPEPVADFVQRNTWATRAQEIVKSLAASGQSPAAHVQDHE